MKFQLYKNTPSLALFWPKRIFAAINYTQPGSEPYLWTAPNITDMKSHYYSSSLCKKDLQMLHFVTNSPFFKLKIGNFNFCKIHLHWLYSDQKGYLQPSITHNQALNPICGLPPISETWKVTSIAVLYVRKTCKCFIS